MKWFKHMANASNDEFLQYIEDKYGLEGYARWWKILEQIAYSMDKNRQEPSVSLVINKWCSLLSAKPKQLLTFLFDCQNQSKIKVEQNGNIIKITCSKLLNMRDEYSRKSGQESDSVPPKSKSKSKSKEVEEEKKERKQDHADAHFSEISQEPEKNYHWMGQVVCLTLADYQKWKTAYRRIDLDEILKNEDEYLAKLPETARNRKSWFFYLGQKLKRAHEEKISLAAIGC